MNKKYTLWRFFKAEHYKTKRNLAVWIILLYPLLVTLLVSLYIYSRAGDFGVEKINYNPWILLSGRYIFYTFYNIFPILTAILCYSLFEIEYGQNNFRLIFTMPYKRWSIYISKMLFLAEIILLSVIVGYVSFLSSGYLLERLIPVLTFSDYNIAPLCANYFLRLYIALLLVAFVQFFFNMKFKNFVVPIGISCFMVILAMVAFNAKYGFLIPYFSVPNAARDFMNSVTAFNRYDLTALIYIPVIFMVNYFTMRRL